MLRKVISGGQTGVDRAGLDAAMAAGVPTGGYCPRGRKAEDGVVPDRYLLQELESAEYCVRTEKNVTDSDGTLILNKGKLSEGTLLTYQYTVKHLQPCLVVQLDGEPPTDPCHVVRWIHGQKIKILNVAGPRESKVPDGIYQEAFSYLEKVLSLLRDCL